MSQQRTAEASEAEIAVHWQEEANVNPPEKFVVQANLTDKTVLERFSLDNFPDCFKEYADLLDWYKTWDVTLDTSNPPFWRWFVGGRINASYNCVAQGKIEQTRDEAMAGLRSRNISVSVEAMIDQLATKYAAERDAIATDVIAMLQDLADKAFLTEAREKTS